MKLKLTLMLLAPMPLLVDLQTISAPEVNSIPLASVYTSSDQEGTKGLLESVRKSDKLRSWPQMSGIPVIFMMNGADLLDVLDKSNQLFELSRETKSSKFPTEIKNREKQWVVAYIGSDGYGPAYVVKSVEIEGKKIRISFEFRGGGALLIEFHYLVWVPLENLPPDEYQLELYDVGAKKVAAAGKCKVLKN